MNLNTPPTGLLGEVAEFAHQYTVQLRTHGGVDLWGTLIPEVLAFQEKEKAIFYALHLLRLKGGLLIERDANGAKISERVIANPSRA